LEGVNPGRFPPSLRFGGIPPHEQNIVAGKISKTFVGRIMAGGGFLLLEEALMEWDEVYKGGRMKKVMFLLLVAMLTSSLSYAGDREYIGRYSRNPIASDSTSNPVGQYGSTVSPSSINNPVGQFGSPVSPNSARNPLATDTPKLYSQDGHYLGKVSSNTLDPDSISNPVGRYGSPVSPDSVNNPVGRYGSTVSSESANNPLATEAPNIIYEGDGD